MVYQPTLKSTYSYILYAQETKIRDPLPLTPQYATETYKMNWFYRSAFVFLLFAIAHRLKINKCSFLLSITKTRLYNFDSLKPHFYIVKLGFTGVCIIFLIFAQKHRLWVPVRTASSRRFSRVPTVYGLSKNMKNIRIF